MKGLKLKGFKSLTMGPQSGGASPAWAQINSLFGSHIVSHLSSRETSGFAAQDESANNLDGVYRNDGSNLVGLTLAQPGAGHQTSVLVDGASGYINWFSNGLRDAFPRTAGTVGIVVKVPAAAWTDGVRREVIRFIVSDANSYLWLSKDSVNNQWWFRWNGNTTIKDIRGASGAPTTATLLTLTWDQAANQIKAYVGPNQFGTTQAFAAWGAALLAKAIVGAGDITPANVTSGWIQNAFLLDYAASQTEVAQVANFH